VPEAAMGPKDKLLGVPELRYLGGAPRSTTHFAPTLIKVSVSSQRVETALRPILLGRSPIPTTHVYPQRITVMR
jgi:hypothetical protein